MEPSRATLHAGQTLSSRALQDTSPYSTSDDLLVRLLQLQHRNGVAVDAVEQLFESGDLFHLDILSVVLDDLGAPPETVQESYCDRFAATVVEGTERECRAFLDWVRAR